MPTLADLLGGEVPTLDRPRIEGPGATALPLDANLEMEGLPQSGTGQISLLTGVNAAERFGRHFGPWPPVRLRDLLASENLLVRAGAAGHHVAFANSYPEGYPGSRTSRRVAAPPLAALAAGVLDRHASALARGDAVSSEIVNDGWRDHLGHEEVPLVSPAEAGRNLARIARAHELTLYAHYSTDHAGHRGGMSGCVEALERVDAFLGGLLEGTLDGPFDGTFEGKPEGADTDPANGEITIVVASDHGNLEDVTAQHTRNPALGLLHGPGTADLAPCLSAITDVAPAILDLLGSSGP